MIDEAFCGIDPGREKFGIAICTSSEIIFSAILSLKDAALAASCTSSGDLSAIADRVIEGSPQKVIKIKKVFIGDGTGSIFFIGVFENANLLYTVIDEKNSTLDARAIYWTLHPPRGLARIIPTSLRTPPRPIDDLAAAVIARRGMLSDKKDQILHF